MKVVHHLHRYTPLFSFGLLVLVFFYILFFSPVRTLGSASDNLGGWVWSDTIGWISLNCLNDGTCGTSAYGVNADTGTGVLSGYAWSDNVGWVSFNSADLSGCPSGTCSARLSGNALQGWARALAPVASGGGSSSSLVARYEFEWNAYDSNPASTLNGTVSGSPTYTDGPTGFGEAVTTSSGNYIYLPETPFDFEKTNPFSVAVWFKSNYAGNYGAIFDKLSNASPYPGFALLFNYPAPLNTGKLSLMLGAAPTPSTLINVATPAGYNDGVWHHVVVTYDGSASSSGVKFYIDGSAVSTTATGGPLGTSALNNVTPDIGRYFRSDTYPFVGSIDDLQIFNKALSASEASQVMAALPSGSFVGLDATSSAATAALSSASSVTFSHTIANKSNRILVVGTEVEDDANCTISTVTYGGQALTKINEISVGTSMRMCSGLWYLLNPSVGSANIVVTATKVVRGITAGGTSLYNVAQTSPEAQNTNSIESGVTSSLTTSITTISSRAWLVDAVGTGDSSALFNPTSGQTKRYEFTSTGAAKGAGGTKYIPNAGATSVTWTHSGTPTRIAYAVAAFAPAVSSSGGGSGGGGSDPQAGGWDGWISLSGSSPSYGPTKSGVNFSGYAWGSDVLGWLDFSQVLYGVSSPPTVDSFTSSPANPITPGTDVTLTWASTNAASCDGSGAWSGSKATSGSEDVGSVAASQSYILTCHNFLGDSTPATVNVIVQDQDFSLAKTQDVSMVYYRSLEASTTITVLPQNGFSGNVIFSALPASLGPVPVTYTFTPPTLTSGQYGNGTVLTITAASQLDPGNYTVQVTADGGTIQRTINIGVTGGIKPEFYNF